MTWLRWRLRRRRDTCRVTGCRRAAAGSIWMWHPSGRTQLAVCDTHRERFAAEPYDQAVDTVEDWANGEATS